MNHPCDRQTDGQTDGISIAYMLSRVITRSFQLSLNSWIFLSSCVSCSSIHVSSCLERLLAKNCWTIFTTVIVFFLRLKYVRLSQCHTEMSVTNKVINYMKMHYSQRSSSYLVHSISIVVTCKITKILWFLWPPASYSRPSCFTVVLSFRSFFLSSFFSPPKLRGRLADRHQTMPQCSINCCYVWPQPNLCSNAVLLRKALIRKSSANCLLKCQQENSAVWLHVKSMC